jgi:hypothetical protein
MYEQPKLVRTPDQIDYDQSDSNTTLYGSESESESEISSSEDAGEGSKSYNQQLQKIQSTVGSYLRFKSPTESEKSNFVKDLKDMTSAVKGERSTVGRCLILQLIAFAARVKGPRQMAKTMLRFGELYTPLEGLKAELTRTEIGIIKSFFVEQSSIEDMVEAVESIKNKVGDDEKEVLKRLDSLLPSARYLEQIVKHAHYLALVRENRMLDLEDHYVALKTAWEALGKITVDGSQGCQ